LIHARGNQLSVLDPMNQLTRRVYGPGSDGDEPDLDQIIQPDPAGGTNYTVTTFGHDNAENITSVTDPMQRLQSAGFDADNRQTSITLRSCSTRWASPSSNSISPATKPTTPLTGAARC
jgi:hypothetical protein